LYCDVCHTFRKIVDATGVGSPRRPRFHDIRHYADGWVMRPAVTFALAAAAEPVLPSA
jgi:hypothetical protein